MNYYVREGRRFVQVKSLKGMFYNNDGTFTEKRTDKSIGICVHDDFEETIIASLNASKNPATYDIAKSACKAAFPFAEGHIPSHKELYMAMEYEQYIDIKGSYVLWTSESISNDFARILNRYVLPFLTIKK